MTPMLNTSLWQPSLKVGMIGALAVGLLFLGVCGCTQKVAWKPPDEPKVTAPPPEAPPRVDYQVFYVAADRLNLRACPGMDCPRITTLNRNQEVEKVGESQGWFQVRSRQDGTLGWVDARYLAGAPVSETATLPTETAPPAKPAKPAEAKPETKPRVKPATPAGEEEEEEAPAPRRRRVPEAQAAEPPAKPETGPASETPATPLPTAPAPAAPTDSGKKKIRIM